VLFPGGFNLIGFDDGNKVNTSLIGDKIVIKYFEAIYDAEYTICTTMIPEYCLDCYWLSVE